MGHAVALRFKPAGRGFDSQWCHWNYLLRLQWVPGIFLGGQRRPMR